MITFPNLPQLLQVASGDLGVWVLVVLALVTAIKVWPRLREMQLGADGALRADLLARIAKLESQLTSVMEEQAAERERHAAEIQILALRHAAEMQVLRHRLNNETHALDALLMLLETNPERTAESVAKIKEMRGAQRQQIALEQRNLPKSGGANRKVKA